jgi:hypothetical protein
MGLVGPAKPAHANKRYLLHGRYDYWVAQHGARRARVIFAMQSVGAVVSFWSDWLLRRLKLVELLTRRSP